MRYFLFGLILITASCTAINLDNIPFLPAAQHPYGENRELLNTVDFVEPRTETVLFRQNVLESNKAKAKAGEEPLLSAYNRLIQQANHFYSIDPPTVTDKDTVRAGRTANDYVSQAIYWWPDPNQSDGLPYIRRDGQLNPETHNLDFPRIVSFAASVNTMAQAWFFSDDDRFADRAVEFLDVWYCAPETRMNPHLRYAQGIPGRNDGRASGIIDTYLFIDVLDSIYILRNSDAWNDEIEACLHNWFDEFLVWLVDGPYSAEEANARNNHGTWYDAQVVAYAVFTGRKPMAASILNAVTKDRIRSQINSEGRQPREMSRTRPVEYSTYNLLAYHALERYGRQVGVNLLDYRTERSAGLQGAASFLDNYIRFNPQDVTDVQRRDWWALRGRMLGEPMTIPDEHLQSMINRYHREMLASTVIVTGS